MIRVSGESKSRPGGCGGRCWDEKSKIARRCGEKHIFKSKCTKTEGRVSEHFLKVRCRKNCTPLWRNANLQMKMLKHWRPRTTFWSSAVEKLYAAVAKRTFGSENVKKLRVRGHFLKFWRRKNACRCSEKQIWKWKCTKHVSFGALFDVLMSKN